MADTNDSQKTEQPTEKKIKDSREEGTFTKSKDIQQLTPVVVMFALIAIFYKYIIFVVSSAYDNVFKLYAQKSIPLGYKEEIWLLGAKQINLMLLLVAASAIICVAVAIIQQGGVTFAKNWLKFNFDKLNPASNLKQLFSIKNIQEFCLNILKIIVISIIVFMLIRNYLGTLLLMHNQAINLQIKLIVKLIGNLALTIFIICVLFAAVDYIISYRATMKQIMMSLQDIKDEQKETIGNPEILSRRKELHRELVEDDNMANTLKDATLILANPTHIAIVLYYSPKKYPLPVLVLKTKGDKAQRIFRVAKKVNVPIIRDKWLARQLYTYGENGKYIPKRLLPIVAELINKNINLMPKLLQEITSLYKPQTNASHDKKVEKI